MEHTLGYSKGGPGEAPVKPVGIAMIYKRSQRAKLRSTRNTTLFSLFDHIAEETRSFLLDSLQQL